MNNLPLTVLHFLRTSILGAGQTTTPRQQLTLHKSPQSGPLGLPTSPIVTGQVCTHRLRGGRTV